jgi:tetratricopeptide (TPR) repeat protein
VVASAGALKQLRNAAPLPSRDPCVNVAITLERAGKTDEALSTYTAALEVYPEYLPAIEGVASLTARTGTSDEHMRAWLKEISSREENPRWHGWATEQLSRVK